MAVEEPVMLYDCQCAGCAPSGPSSKDPLTTMLEPVPKIGPSATQVESCRTTITFVPAAGGTIDAPVKVPRNATSITVPPTSTNIEFGVASTTTPMRDSVKRP